LDRESDLAVLLDPTWTPRIGQGLPQSGACRIGNGIGPTLARVRKNQINPMKKIPPFALAAMVGGILLIGCGREPGNESERVSDQVSENRKEMAKADDNKEWMNERDEAARELRDLRESMTDRLEREQKRLSDGIKDAERRQECETHIRELQANIERIDGQLGRLNAGTATDWDRLKTETRAFSDTTSNWFKRQVEKIDRKTDADADDDGH
jgi:hypothetical protein